MKKLEGLRHSLDNLDSALISILSERFKLTYEVGVFKAENNLPSIDEERERKQFESVPPGAAETKPISNTSGTRQICV